MRKIGIVGGGQAGFHLAFGLLDRTARSGPARDLHELALMRILVTNDDGIYSPGLCALAEAASEIGEVRIVAPDVEQSSMAHAVTSSRPLHHRRAKIGKFDAWRVNGTPADCVALGSHVWGKVDLVFSGINLV